VLFGAKLQHFDGECKKITKNICADASLPNDTSNSAAKAMRSPSSCPFYEFF